MLVQAVSCKVIGTKLSIADNVAILIAGRECFNFNGHAMAWAGYQTLGIVPSFNLLRGLLVNN